MDLQSLAGHLLRDLRLPEKVRVGEPFNLHANIFSSRPQKVRATLKQGEAINGLDGIREVLNLFVPPTEAIEFEVLHTAVRGNLVFTERIDRFTMGGRTIDLPVAGVFELRDGRIAAWRDYFDLATWQRAAG